MANLNQEQNPSTSSLPLISSTSRSSSSGTSNSTSTSSTMHRATGRIAVSDRNNSNTGIYNEQVLTLLFRFLNWDLQTLCSTACTSRRHRAVAERILFYELCLSRVPRLVSAILATPVNALPHDIGGSAPRLPGGWPALAKILLYCCGCTPSLLFALSNPVPGHFTTVTRFSKTSGKSFLVRRCWGDVLYVSDPCEHASLPGEEHDLGVYRGVFGGFVRSRTRACLIGQNAELEEHIRCPYCGARVWSMTAAGLVPRSATTRLGSLEDGLEYFVCVNGHLHGSCWLTPLSSSSDDGNSEDNGGSDRQSDGDEMGTP
ncbi:hypothetical protein LUZ63_015701 [Rhynchospora breviuscula]|uniref:EID1-like F-box protein 3 n=1 Tax=Rhynchospora breviuscula TaxID=2022672 RepID=A0A9Q0CCU0_9POAL|nr:hypothetical protein LUZ63_015701 [Rhynchospora breviuscula]